MAHRAAGTLALPWSQPSPRSGKQRVAADHTLLAVTMTLALVGLVMVFSASAIVAGNRFQDPGFFLKRQVAWLAFGFLLMHLTSRIDYTFWKKLSIPMLACTPRVNSSAPWSCPASLCASSNPMRTLAFGFRYREKYRSWYLETVGRS